MLGIRKIVCQIIGIRKYLINLLAFHHATFPLVPKHCEYLNSIRNYFQIFSSSYVYLRWFYLVM